MRDQDVTLIFRFEWEGIEQSIEIGWVLISNIRSGFHTIPIYALNQNFTFGIDKIYLL